MKLLLAALVMVLALGGAAWADDADWADCNGTNPGKAIRGCTHIIDAGRESIDAGRETKANLAIAYVNRGVAYERKGDYDREIADETKAVELNPDYAIAYYNRGIAYDNKGEHERAIADETKAIQLKPDYVEAYYNRGLLYVKKGEHERAIADETKAIQLKPDNGYAYYGRGMANAAKGDPAKALTDFRAAAQLIPASDQWNGQALARVAELEKQIAVTGDKAAEQGGQPGNAGDIVTLPGFVIPSYSRGPVATGAPAGAPPIPRPRPVPGTERDSIYPTISPLPR